MMPRTPASRRRRTVSRSRTPPATRSSMSTARAPPTSSWGRSRRLGTRGGCGGRAASRSALASRPTASQSPATARQPRSVVGSSATATPTRTRVAPAAKASGIPSAESTPPANWSGVATRAAIVPTASRLTGAPARAPPKATRGRSGGPERGGPPRQEDDPRAAALEVDRRDDLHGAGPASGSRGGAIDPVRARRHGLVLAGQEPAVEADRQPAVAEERVVERAERERAPQPPPLVVAQAEDQDLPEQVRKGVGRRRGVAPDLGQGVGALEPGVLDEEVGRRLDRDLAPMHPDVEDDPAGPPDRVRGERQAELRAIVEALLAHHLLAVHAPALDELRGVAEEPAQRRVPDRDRQLEVVARVGLVDAGVADRGPVVLAHRVGVVVA